jgi:hypothetical protein
MKSISSFAAVALLPVQSLSALNIGEVTAHHLRHQEHGLIGAFGPAISRNMAERS